MCQLCVKIHNFKELALDRLFRYSFMFYKYLATMDTLRSFHLLILVFTFSASAFAFNMPRLGILPITMQHEPQTISSISHPEDFKTYYYNQKLDHFNYRLDSYTTFKQRYVINYRYWGGANASAPIFAYLGAEFPLDEEFPNIGFLSDNAPRFKALQVYIEVKP